MHRDEIDHFKLWESSLSSEPSVVMPPDPLNGIIDQSSDPIECAKNLHYYTYDNPEESHSLLMRRGLAKLAYKYYGQYLNKPLAITAENPYAIPENDPKLRKRDVLTPIQYEGTVFAMGNLATFTTAHYTDDDIGLSQTFISLRLSEPHILKPNGEIRTEFELPDYLFVPIPRLLTYSFKPGV